MNIFVLDEDIKRCAQYHCDKHVVKMILESTQILCSVLYLNDIKAPYKPTHLKHPCVMWCNESLSNFKWVLNLIEELQKEYNYRYKKIHKSYLVSKSLQLPSIEDKGLTNFSLVVPDKYKNKNVVQSYREYYKNDKKLIAKYTGRKPPKWFN